MKCNKKAVSEVVSYVVLIVIAIAIAAFVYPYIKNLVVPPEKETCPENVFLSIEQVLCDVSEQNLSIQFVNRGLFSVSGAYVRLGEPNATARQQINQGQEIFPRPLPPDETITYKYHWPATIGTQPGQYMIEIQPAILKNRQIALCQGPAIVVQGITCTA